MNGANLEMAEAIEQIVQGTSSALSGFERLTRALQSELDAAREREAAAATQLALYRERAEALQRVAGHVEHFRSVLDRVMYPEVRAQLAALENPVEQFVVGAGRMLEEGVVVSDKVAAALRRAVLERVEAHLEEHPVLRPLRAALLFRLSSRFRKEFGGRRGYLVPRVQEERAFRYVESFPLPGPDSMKPFQLQLICARARLGLSTAAAARIIGVTPGTYVRWEMGDSEPHPRYEAVVAAFLERAGLAGGRVVPMVGYERAADPGRLAELRRRAGLTQREAAARAGIPQYTVSRLERGRAVRGGRALEARLLAFYRGLLGGGEAAEA
ncbi:MAG: helix-turn-helix domain-containing protein [Bacillota bacterium]